MVKGVSWRQQPQKTGAAIPISHKTDFTTKNITRGNKGHFVIWRGLAYQEDIIIINTDAPNKGAPTYMKQKLTEMKAETDNSTVL